MKNSKTLREYIYTHTYTHGYSSNRNGITLIVLIITIIVLLILAGVSISLVMGDNGLMVQATNAKQEQKLAEEKEKIQLATGAAEMKGLGIIEEDALTEAMDGEFGLGKWQYNESPSEDKDYFLVKVIDSNRVYKIFKNGNVNVTPEDSDVFLKYILGENLEGRDINDILIGDNDNIPKFNNEETTLPNAENDVKLLLIDDDDNVYIKYNNIAYVFSVVGVDNDGDGIEDWFKTQRPTEKYVPTGREGNIVQYDGDGDGVTEDWRVITDRNGKIEIVSSELRGELTLGAEDKGISSEILDLDNDGIKGDNGDRAIASYNNAITRINKYCDDLISQKDGETVRSVGAATEIESTYTSANFEKWHTGSTTLKDSDNSYIDDLIKIHFYENFTETNQYLIASRGVREDESEIWFNIRCGGTISDEGIIAINESGWDDTAAGSTAPVRPIVVNPQGL